MSINEVVSIIGGVLGIFSVIVGAIWGYAKLNHKVKTVEEKHDRLDSATGTALEKISEAMKYERERSDTREDMLRTKMDSFDNKLTDIHLNMVKNVNLKE